MAKKKKASLHPNVRSSSIVKERAEFGEILLGSCSAGHHILDRSNLPKKMELTIKTEATHSVLDNNKEEVMVILDFKVNAYYSQEDDNPALFFQCEYVLNYDFSPGKDPTELQLTSFAALEGLPLAWPYLREYVQDTSGRMGLPALRVPTFDRTALTSSS